MPPPSIQPDSLRATRYSKSTVRPGAKAERPAGRTTKLGLTANIACLTAKIACLTKKLACLTQPDPLRATDETLADALEHIDGLAHAGPSIGSLSSVLGRGRPDAYS